MRQILFLILLALAGVARAFDTSYIPGQHMMVLPIQCDDRVDSQFVNIALARGIKISFAPYRDGATQIIDIDSTDFNYSGTATKGEFNEWLNQWAYNLGMPFATHAQHQSPTVYATYGEAGVDSVFDFESQYVKRTTGMRHLPLGHVWTGHVNSPKVRAFAREYGYTYTRGDWGNSKDLYLPAYGWQNDGGRTKMAPMCMNHRALIPSISTNTVFGTLPTNQNAADTTGIWESVYDFCTEMAGKNGFGVLNIHPGWGVPHAETESDTMVVSTVTVAKYGTGDTSIIARSRFGDNGRNDVSAYQLDYILAAMDYWDDSAFAADGLRRICIPNIDDLITSTDPNWRNDNTSNPDNVEDIHAGGVYWGSTDPDAAGYDWDPALTPIASKIIYVDGTGAVKAGNGTATYPLPWSSLNHLFNCTVSVIGHEPGDTLYLKAYNEPNSGFVNAAWWKPRTGNVIYDFNGLTLLAPSTTKAIVQVDSIGYAYFNHNIEWRDVTIDFAASTGTTNFAFIIGNTSTAAPDSLDPMNIRFKGVTFRNGACFLKGRNCQDVVVDSCFFDHGVTTAGSTAYSGGEINENTLIKNSLFDMYDTGASSIVVDFNTTLEPADSMRFLNNIAILGDSSPTTSAHYLLRTTNATVDTTAALTNSLRWDGNYVVNNITGSSKANIWNDLARGAARPWSQFQARITAYKPTFSGSIYMPGARASYNYLTQANDTLRFGGYTGPGSWQTGTWASIGPSQYGYFPRISLNQVAIAGAEAGAHETLWSMAAMYNSGVLAPCDTLNASTFARVSRPNTPAEQAQFQILLSEYENLPAATRQKMKLTTVY